MNSLLPSDILANMRIGISASPSPDLDRLGLLEDHFRLALGSLARTVLVLGGTLQYCGHLAPDGYTTFLIGELKRYARSVDSLSVVLAWSVHRKLTLREIQQADENVGRFGSLKFLDVEGKQIKGTAERDEVPPGVSYEEIAPSLTAMRKTAMRDIQGRLFLGGRRCEYQGVMPGVIEEAILALSDKQPIYFAGGFGGVTCDMVAQVDSHAASWLLPDSNSMGDKGWEVGLEHFAEAIGEQGWESLENGLSAAENSRLAATHRPSEIAALVSLGLGRLSHSHNRKQTINIFVSYSRKDSIYLTQFKKLLSFDSSANVWDDTCVSIGNVYQKQINEKMKSADLIVYLVSKNFLASEPCKTEWKTAQEFEKNVSLLIPVILEECMWKGFDNMSDFPALPRNGKPIKNYESKLEGWYEVVKEIQNTIKIRMKRQEIQRDSPLTQFILGKMLDSVAQDKVRFIKARKPSYLAIETAEDKQEEFDFYKSFAELGYARAQYKLGLMYLKGEGIKKDKQEAFYWYKVSAEQGYARAQYKLGLMYLKGEGIKKDKQEAFYWYKVSAEHGYARAQYKLGSMYLKGEGIEENKKEAFYWYKKTAEHGYARAQYKLGSMYLKGEGIEEDKQEAFNWYKKSAEQEYARAQFKLAVMYDDGEGIEMDKKEAFYWYKKSSRHGYPRAQFALGWMYANGVGVLRDNQEAVEWYKKSSNQGYDLASLALLVTHP